MLFPWTRTDLPSSMPPAEFVEWLRAQAIAFGASSLMVNHIDGLQGLLGLEEDNEKLAARLEDEQERISDLLTELRAAETFDAVRAILTEADKP